MPLPAETQFPPELLREMADPIKLAQVCWPSVTFYREQRQIIYSVEENDETYVVAGNMLGKDFITGYICLRAFLVNTVARIVTTSVKDDHLRVLWGEIGRFITTCRFPLVYNKSVKNPGPLRINHRDITKVDQKTGEVDRISYLRGMVSERGEGLAGHHAPYTLAVGDEASGIEDQSYMQFQGWAKRMLFIGNPNPSQGFFYKNVKAGDLRA